MTTSKSLAQAFAEALVRAARAPGCDRVLVVGVDPSLLRRLKPSRDKVIVASSELRDQQLADEVGCAFVAIPPMRASRHDRLKVALVAAMNAGLVRTGEKVACGVLSDDGELDTLLHLAADEVARETPSVLVAPLRTHVPAALLEVLVDLALRIGREGYEGRPIGTLIVVGDSTHVMEQSTALTMNPFQGYSEQERNLFDRAVRSAIRQFAMLDGAFIVREDGVVLAAGRHIRVAEAPAEVPLGWGARHLAAATVSQQTEAVAIVVSQTSGKVRVFDGGQVVLEVAPDTRRGVDGSAQGRGSLAAATPPSTLRGTRGRRRS